MKVNFTGSARVGSIIGQLCGKLIKPVVLELGGMSPLVILSDADLEAAVNAAVFGSFVKSGQVCMSTSMIIVHESIATEFLSIFRAQVAQLKAGADEDCTMRGVFCVSSANRLQKLVQDALDKGAKIAAGTFDVQQNIMQPVALEYVTKDMDIYQQEIFGPIVSIHRFKTDEEAIGLANDIPYGLSAAVYSEDIEHASRIANGIYTGVVQINAPTHCGAPRTPHGGVKQSGFGRFDGAYGIREFTWPKVLTVNKHQKYPI